MIESGLQSLLMSLVFTKPHISPIVRYLHTRCMACSSGRCVLTGGKILPPGVWLLQLVSRV